MGTRTFRINNMLTPYVPIPEVLEVNYVKDFLTQAFSMRLTHTYVASWFLTKLNKKYLIKEVTPNLDNKLLVLLNKELPFIELSTWVDLYNNARD